MTASVLVLDNTKQARFAAREEAAEHSVAPQCQGFQAPPPSDAGSDESLESYLPAQAGPEGEGLEQEAGPDSPHQPAPPAVPTREALAASPDFPVLVTADPLAGVSLPGASRGGHLPVNEGRPIPFESPLFSGQAAVFIRGLPSSPAGLFQGQKRKTLLVVQGRFRESVGFDDLVTGQEFERARHLPPAWLLDNVLLKVARSISPSMEVGPSRAPFMLMPLVAGANEIHAARPGQQPPLCAPPREDMRLVDARLAAPDGSPLPCARRRALFSDPSNRAARTFDPGLVWTFYIYQHLVDVASYTLNMVYKFHLPRYLDGQPLQLMLKDRRRGRYLLRLHMWHKELLADAEAQQAQRART